MKAGTLERTLRIAYSVAYWLARLVDEGQATVWLGDRDEIWVNDAISTDFRALMSDAIITTGYRGRRFGDVALLYADSSYVNKPSRDLLAVPDLVAGSLVRAMSDMKEASPQIKEGMDSLLDIGTDPSGNLSHVIYKAISEAGQGELLKFTRATQRPLEP